jgi:hypothetical protein
MRIDAYAQICIKSSRLVQKFSLPTRRTNEENF